MNGEERNNQQFQQHHYEGIVQGIPVVDDPSAPPVSSTSNYAPPPYPPTTAAPVAPNGASQNYVPPTSTMSGNIPTTANSTPLPATNTATAVSNNTTVVVNSGGPVIEVIDDRLPCGCGTGWFMFIFGWFFAIPWYVGACILICGKIDPRERPGHIACAVMAGIFTIALIVTSTHHASNGY